MNDKNLRKWIVTYLIREGLSYYTTMFYITDDYLKLGRRSNRPILMGEFATSFADSTDHIYIVARDISIKAGKYCVCAKFPTYKDAVGFIGRSKIRNVDAIMYRYINGGDVGGKRLKIAPSIFD